MQEAGSPTRGAGRTLATGSWLPEHAIGFITSTTSPGEVPVYGRSSRIVRSRYFQARPRRYLEAMVHVKPRPVVVAPSGAARTIAALEKATLGGQLVAHRSRPDLRATAMPGLGQSQSSPMLSGGMPGDAMPGGGTEAALANSAMQASEQERRKQARRAADGVIHRSTLSLFDAIDANSDGVVSPAELLTHMLLSGAETHSIRKVQSRAFGSAASSIGSKSLFELGEPVVAPRKAPKELTPGRFAQFWDDLRKTELAPALDVIPPPTKPVLDRFFCWRAAQFVCFGVEGLAKDVGARELDSSVEGLLMIAPSTAQDCKPESGGHVLAIVRAGQQPLSERVQPVRVVENAVQQAIAQRKSPNDNLSIELQLVAADELVPAEGLRLSDDAWPSFEEISEELMYERAHSVEVSRKSKGGKFITDELHEGRIDGSGYALTLLERTGLRLRMSHVFKVGSEKPTIYRPARRDGSFHAYVVPATFHAVPNATRIVAMLEQRKVLKVLHEGGVDAAIKLASAFASEDKEEARLQLKPVDPSIRVKLWPQTWLTTFRAGQALAIPSNEREDAISYRAGVIERIELGGVGGEGAQPHDGPCYILRVDHPQPQAAVGAAATIEEAAVTRLRIPIRSDAGFMGSQATVMANLTKACDVAQLPGFGQRVMVAVGDGEGGQALALATVLDSGASKASGEELVAARRSPITVPESQLPPPHLLELLDGRRVRMRLCRFNHCLSRFSRLEDYETARKALAAALAEETCMVEDAITGVSLRIEEQLLHVELGDIEQSGDCGGRQIDAYKHLKSVQPLAEKLLEPSPDRHAGGHVLQPVLICAQPGTGKTWSSMQLTHELAKRCAAMDSGTDGVPFVPMLIYVQRLTRILEANSDSTTERVTTRALLQYVAQEYPDRVDWLATFAQALEMSMLVLVLDGIDEAGGRRGAVADFALKELVPLGIRLLVTSRPEGVNLSLFRSSFVILDLQPLSDAQQSEAVQQQLKELPSAQEFFGHLMQFCVIRQRHNQIYGAAFPAGVDCDGIEHLPRTDKLTSAYGGCPDPSTRMRAKDGGFVRVRSKGAPVSDYLKRLNAFFTSERLRSLDALLDELPMDALPHHVEAALTEHFEANGGADRAQTTIATRLMVLAVKRRGVVGASRGAKTRAGLATAAAAGLTWAASSRAVKQQVSHEDEGTGLSRQTSTIAPPAPSEQRDEEDEEEEGQDDGGGGNDDDAEEEEEQPGMVAQLWQKIVMRTDMLYEVAEKLQPVFERFLRAELADVAPEDGAGGGGMGKADGAEAGSGVELIFGSLKDPVRTHEKADDYAPDFDDWNDAYVIPEACVRDICRARAVCRSAHTMLLLQQRLEKGLHREGADGVKTSVTLVRAKNKFEVQKLDPTRFRNVLNNLKFTHGDVTTYVELQCHHAAILEYNDESHAHAHYDFFRARLTGRAYMQLEGMLERVLTFLEGISGVPVLLSILIVVFAARGGATLRGDATELPSSRYELYKAAIEAMLQRQCERNSNLQLESALAVLRKIAWANHVAQRRVFTTSEVHAVFDTVKAGKQRLAVMQAWNRLPSPSGELPLLKVLEVASAGSEARYQFRHLSLGEALAAEAIVHGDASGAGLTEGKWDSHQAAARFLNDPFNFNLCRIGGGKLGSALATRRPRMKFDGPTSLDKQGITAFALLLQGRDELKDLQSLKIGNLPPGCTTDLVSHLCSAFQRGTADQVRTLSLWDNAMGAGDAEALARGLATVPMAAMTYLGLRGNPLGDAGVQAFIALLNGTLLPQQRKPLHPDPATGCLCALKAIDLSDAGASMTTAGNLQAVTYNLHLDNAM